jgi:16S rRNA (cytosine1402-N4)-methyltransferase
LAQVFQALRIEVNEEIEALKKLLESSTDLLQKGGRIAVISYHSIEDRLVKNFFKKGNFEGKEVKDFYGNLQKPFDEVNRHPIVPSEQEIEANNRARSAKLRIAQKR